MTRLDIIETMLDICEIMQHEYNEIEFGDRQAREKSYMRDKWEQYASRLNDEHMVLCYGASVENKQPNVGVSKE